MAHPLKIEGKPLDRWVEIRIRSAQRRMPIFDELPAALREALSNMKSGPKWKFIEGLHKSVERGTTVKYLLKKIAKEDELQLSEVRLIPAAGQAPRTTE